jgi:P2 family phage contractile tail tube protein
MGMPRILKDMMIFNAGNAYIGEALSFTPPKLVRKLEEHRAGGMDRAVKVDMGGEPLECEIETAGPMRDVLGQYGGAIDAVMLRLVGTYQNDQTRGIDTLEFIVRGRHEEIDLGSYKVGEKNENKSKLALTYVKFDWNGATIIEIDVLNMVEIVDGIDRLAERRAALGI